MKFIKTRSNITVIADKVYTIGKADLRFSLLVNIEELSDSEIHDILNYKFLTQEQHLDVVDGKLIFNGFAITGNMANMLVNQYKRNNTIKGISNLIFNIENHDYDKEKSYRIMNEYEFSTFTDDGFCNIIINDEELELSNTPFIQIFDSCIIEQIKQGKTLSWILSDIFKEELGKKTFQFYKEKIIQDTLNEELLKFIIYSSKIMNAQLVKGLAEKNLTIDLPIFDLLSKFIPQQKRLINALLKYEDNVSELKVSIELYTEIRDDISIPNKKFNISDIVHFIEREYKRLGKENNKELYLNKYDFIRNLKVSKFDDYDIIFPESSFELTKWGMLMDNCIGGRVQSTINGSKIPFAIYKNGRLMYCAEIIKKGGFGDFETYNKVAPSVDFTKKLTRFLISNNFNSYATKLN